MSAKPYRRIVGPPELAGTPNLRKKVISVRRSLKLRGSSISDRCPLYIDEGHVYFVQDDKGMIKIGLATNVKDRVTNLQTANSGELVLLGFMDHKKGQYEKVIHSKFKHLHLRGEWFSPGADLLLFIKENAKQ